MWYYLDMTRDDLCENVIETQGYAGHGVISISQRFWQF